MTKYCAFSQLNLALTADHSSDVTQQVMGPVNQETWDSDWSAAAEAFFQLVLSYVNQRIWPLIGPSTFSVFDVSAYFRCPSSRWDNRNRSTAAPVRRSPHSSSRNYYDNGRLRHAERARHRKRCRRGRRSRRCLFGSARKRNRRDWKRRRLQHPGQRRSPLVADRLQRWEQSTSTPILHLHL